MATYNVNKLSQGANAYNLKDFRNAGVYYGTCVTAAATQQKEVVITDARGNQFFELTTGTIFFVKFTNSQAYNGAPTMRINSTAATLKNIKRYGTTNAARYEWYAGEIVGFIYDGANYIIIDGIDGLPAVSSSDNGKVLRVVDGAWAAATVPDANGVSF